MRLLGSVCEGPRSHVPVTSPFHVALFDVLLARRHDIGFVFALYQFVFGYENRASSGAKKQHQTVRC